MDTEAEGHPRPPAEDGGKQARHGTRHHHRDWSNTTPDLTSKRTVVIGAANAHAAAIALACAEAGSNVFLTNVTGDVEEAFSLRRLAKKIEALGRHARADSLDVSLPTAVQVGVRQIAKALDGLDLAVIATDVPFQRAAESTSDAEWAKTVALNFSAVFYLCRAIGKEMRNANPDATPKGRIVVLLPGVDEGATRQAAYAASRAGAGALVAALATEWAPEIIVRGISLSGEADEAKVAKTALRALSGETDASSEGILSP